MDARILILFPVILLCTQALPFKEKENGSCIDVTPERAAELNKISEEVNIFINDLADKHEDIDFTFIELKVENHSEDENDDKETILKISVNDCNVNATNHPKKEDKYFESDDDDYNDSKSVHENTRNTKVSENIDEKTEDETKSDDSEGQTSENDDNNHDRTDNSETVERYKKEQSINKLSKASESKHKENENSDVNINETGDTKRNKESSENNDNNNSQRNSFNGKKTKSKSGSIDDMKDIDDVSVDSNPGKQYNINGDYNNLLLYAPNVDKSKSKIDIINDSYYQNLLDLFLRKIINNKCAIVDKKNTNFLAGLQKYYDNFPVGDNFDYFQPYDYDNSYAEEPFRNFLKNKMRNGDRKPKFYVYNGLENNYDGFLNEFEDNFLANILPVNC